MEVDRACFFMLCTNLTEPDCLRKGLFGDREFRLSYLRSIKIYMILVIIPYILLSIFLVTGFIEIYYAPLWIFGILNFISSYKIYKYPTEKNAVYILDKMIMPINMIQTLTVLILWYLFGGGLNGNIQ